MNNTYPLFEQDFLYTVQNRYGEVKSIQENPFYVIALNEKVSVNLVRLNSNVSAQELINLQQLYQQKGIMLVNLWQDVWIAKRQQVLSRLDSFNGLNKTLHGRKAKIAILEANEAKVFLDENHLQGFIKTKHLLGLSFNNELMAVACFSSARPMKSKGITYKSAELVRFATKAGFTVVGGLGRLIGAFLKENKVNDLMTYADRDWSLGSGYDKLGFKLAEATQAVVFYVNTNTLIRYAAHRLPKAIIKAYQEQNNLSLNDFLADKDYTEVFNIGNFKYYLYTNG